MFHIVLVHPQIPPNTGNIIRLCANTGAHLHLIEPLGFQLSDKNFKRAGLDYHELTNLSVHQNFQCFLEKVAPKRLWAIETCGDKNYDAVSYEKHDAIIFGSETRGLPQALLEQIPKTHQLKIPMLPNNRSINLSNTVAIVLYEAWGQLSWANAKK